MPVLGLVAFLPLLVTAEVQIATGIGAEARVGEIPRVAGTGSTAFVSTIVTPAATVLRLDRRSELSLHYEPRMLWRDPPEFQVRPLLFHSLVLAHRHRLARTAEWKLQLAASYGEVDYVALGQLLSTQTTIPRTNRIFASENQASGTWQVDRRTRLELGARLTYRRFLDAPANAASADPASVPTLVAQNTLRLIPQMTRHLTRQERLGVSSELALYALTSNATADGPTGFSALVWQPQLGWNEQGPSHSLWARAGISVAGRLVESTPARSWTPVWPVGELGLAWLLHHARDLELRGELTVASIWYLEPVLVAGLPRGLANASLEANIGRKWQTSLYARFSTDVTQAPMVGTPNETLLTAGLPVRFQISPSWLLEAGGRYTQRAPHIAAPNFSFRDRELYGYLKIAFLFRESLNGTRSPTPR
jgi:hypothetical protein